MQLTVSAHPAQLAEIVSSFQKFWNLDTLGIRKEEESNVTIDDHLAQKMQDEITHYDEETKTWSTGLLFKQDPPNVGPNKRKALAILKKVEKTTISTNKLAEVNAAYKEFVTHGFAEEVNEEMEPDRVHYLPGHAVFRVSSSTSKTRIVFNASATSETGLSLNQCLYQGKCLLPEVVEVLLRFRLRKVAFTMDISKMFLRIKLHSGRDYLRYLWRDCDETKPVRTYRMTSVTFGVISSPFQAIDVVLKNADRLESTHPLAAALVRSSLYMDDLLGSFHTIETARKAVAEVHSFFQEAGMTPHKYVANNEDILEQIPLEAKSVEPFTKVLGLIWDTSKDDLLLNLEEVCNIKHSGLDTKRSFLELSAKIFDPTGFLSPFTMRIKLLFQDVWKWEAENQVSLSNEPSKAKGMKAKPVSQSKWDDPLPERIQELWNELKSELPLLLNIRIPRCLVGKLGPAADEFELFAFGDASQKAYAAVIYLVWKDADSCRSSAMVYSKTRVAPLDMKGSTQEEQTIVRLELLAALICARAAKYVQNALQTEVKITDVHFFTDSMINLWRIREGPAKFKLWVANRIGEIRETSNPDQWHHCPGELNPADLPSRGLSARELQSSNLWWQGPTFIREEKSAWPVEKGHPQQKDDEWKKETSTSQVATANLKTRCCSPVDGDFIGQLLNRFEDWNKTLRFIHMVLTFAVKAHREAFKQTKWSLKAHKETKNALWRLSQRVHLQNDFVNLANGLELTPKSSLAGFNPFYDEELGLLRARSRLVLSGLPEETRLPIILPKKCAIVKKYILHLHVIHQHARAGYLHSLLRQEFAIQRGRQQIQTAIWPCTKRNCMKPKPLQQIMAPLPSQRIDNPAPFKAIAVDLFGPMVAFHKCELENCPHPKQSKVYGALYTCFHSRAIHIELIDSQGTESFLTSFRSFVARRGVPSIIYSDNAKNFKAAMKEIRQLYRSINWTAVKDDGIRRNIDWIFSTEKAPHQNGICERMVRSVKEPLRAVIGSAQLTRNQIELILHEIEAVVNNRPLGVTKEDPTEWVPVTPAELVNGRRMDQIPDPKAPLQSTTFSHLWKCRQAILNQFWKRWSANYLLEQGVRRKWKSPSTDDLMGKIVLIKDDFLSRNDWKIGRIIEILPSRDGFIRNVVVQTPTSKLRRAVQKLALFEQI